MSKMLNTLKTFWIYLGMTSSNPGYLAIKPTDKGNVILTGFCYRH